MRRKKNRSIILLLFCLCLAMVLGGEGAKAALDVKIGYVDYARIFWETDKTKELLAKLELEQETDLRILSERRQVTEKEIDKLEEELETQGLMLSESAREEKLTEIERWIEELDNLNESVARREEERGVQATFELEQYLNLNIRSVVKSIAEKEGYRFVFDLRSLFYVTPEKEFDLTDKVLAQLNEEYKAEIESGE